MDFFLQAVNQAPNVTQTNALWDFFSSNLINQSIVRLVGITSGIAAALGGGFFALSFVWQYLQSVLGGQLMPDFRSLGRIWVIWAFIGVYTVGVGAITEIVFLVRGVIVRGITVDQSRQEYANLEKQQQEAKNALAQRMDAQRVAAQEESTPLPSLGATPAPAPTTNVLTQSPPASPPSLLSVCYGDLGMMGNFFLDVVAGLLLSIAKIFITALTVNLVKVLYVLGPLALLVSFIPMFKDQFQVWLSFYLGAMCTMITMAIIDELFMDQTVIQGVLKADIGSTTDLAAGAAAKLSYVVLYCMVFTITSKWIGSSEGGKMISTAMQGMQTAAMQRFPPMGGGPGGGAGGAGTLSQNVGNTGGFSIANN